MPIAMELPNRVEAFCVFIGLTALTVGGLYAIDGLSLFHVSSQVFLVKTTTSLEIGLMALSPIAGLLLIIQALGSE